MQEDSHTELCDTETLDHCASLGGQGAEGICPVSKKPCSRHNHELDPQDFGPDASPQVVSIRYQARKRPATAGWTLNRRWDRAARLFGELGMKRLSESRVTIFGVGGVGSFAAESLARSGVGGLKLVDFDKVCATNVNRQLQAMKGTIGKPKVQVLAERLKLIHPDADIEAVEAFYYADTADELLGDKPDYVIDAIDNVSAKMHLIMTCRQRGIPLVASMGAAGKMDPTMVQVADLSKTFKDPLARDMRKYLRRNYDLNTSVHTGINCVFSAEERLGPFPPSYDEIGGFKCICPGGENGMHDCDVRNQIDGTASFVTGTFGLTCASVVVKGLLAAG